MIKKKVKYREQLSLIIPVKCCIDSDPRLKIKINLKEIKLTQYHN